MREFSTAAIGGVVLFAAYALGAHNALNGTWTLVPGKSDFGGQPVLESGTVTITDREGAIVVTRDFKYEDAGRTVFYSDSSGSEHHQTIHAGDLKSKSRWDGDTLIVTTTKPGAVTTETYRLAPDGMMWVSVETPKLKPITLVFQRQ